MKKAILAAIVLVAASCQARPPRPPPPPPPASATVTVAGSTYRVEWIGTGIDRETVLRTHAPLEKMTGLLIGYDHERIQHHHSEGSRAGYGVLWISRDYRIVEFADLPAGSEEGITSTKEAQYAFFTEAGRIGDDKLLGMKLQFSPEILKAPPSGPPTIRINDFSVHVEVASTTDQRCRGLMHRTRMSENDGMIFIYREPRDLSFWMMHCHYPLDIAFFDADGKFLNVVTIDPYPDPNVDSGGKAPSAGHAKFVVEVNAGWFRRHGLESKAPLRLPPEVTAAAAEAD